jgi:hypothetical protein
MEAKAPGELGFVKAQMNTDKNKTNRKSPGLKPFLFWRRFFAWPEGPAPSTEVEGSHGRIVAVTQFA